MEEVTTFTESITFSDLVLWSFHAVATPADAALMMQMGCDGVFVGSVSANVWWEGRGNFRNLREVLVTTAFSDAVRNKQMVGWKFWKMDFGTEDFGTILCMAVHTIVRPLFFPSHSIESK